MYGITANNNAVTSAQSDAEATESTNKSGGSSGVSQVSLSASGTANASQTFIRDRVCRPIKPPKPLSAKFWQEVRKFDEQFMHFHNNLSLAAEAALTGNLSLLASLTRVVVDLHSKTAFSAGNNFVTLAAMSGQLAIIEWLHSRQVNIHHTNNYGENAVLLAARYGHLDVLKWLNEHGADMSHTDHTVAGAVLYAAKEGNQEVIEYLSGIDVNLNSNCANGQNALMVVAGRGHLELMKFLIAQGGDIASTDYLGMNALLHAASGGHLNIIQYLSRLGSDINTVDSLGENAITLASASGSLETVQWLHSQHVNIHQITDAEKNALMLAAYGGHLNIVEFLYNLDVRIDQVDDLGNDAAMLAAWRGHLAIVQWLYAAGYRTDRVNSNQSNAALLASAQNHFKVVKWLYRHNDSKTQIMQSDRYGRNMSHFAAFRGNMEAVQWLFSLGVDIHQIDAFGRNITHYALTSGNLELVNWLNRHNLDFRWVNNPGEAIINNLAKSDQLKILQWLFEHHYFDRHGERASGTNFLTECIIQSYHPAITHWFYQQGFKVSWLILEVRLSEMVVFIDDLVHNCRTPRNFLAFITNEDPADLLKYLSLENKKIILRTFNFSCESDDQVDERLMYIRQHCRFDEAEVPSLKQKSLLMAAKIIQNQFPNKPEAIEAIKTSGDFNIPAELKPELINCLDAPMFFKSD